MSAPGREGALFEEVAQDEAWLHEQSFGLVVDRLRIVEAAAARLSTNGGGSDTSILAVLIKWVNGAVDLARATS